MSKNLTFGRPGLQYPTDIHKESVPVQKATKMIVDNLFFLHKGIDELASLTGIGGESLQQMITQVITNKFSGGGGGGGGGGGTSIVIHVSTHSIRLSTYGTASDPVGTLFIETDRTAIYYVSDALGPPAWVFGAGMMSGAISLLPTDLGVNDAGFSFVATDATELTHYLWTGTVFITTGGLREIITDAITNSTSNVFRMAHRSSGVPAANFGGNVLTELDSSTNVLRAASGLNTIWSSATDTAETSVWSVQLRVLGAALSDFFQVLSTGIRLKVGSFFGKFTHANSADRTYTLADADGNLVYETSALTDHAIVLGNAGAKVKPGTLGTTVTVLHGNASGDPTYSAVVLTTDVSGVLPVANGGGLSGTYVPTCTAGTNVTTMTPGTFTYLRVGSAVVVSGRIDYVPTAPGSFNFRVSLPIPSNIGSSSDCAGTYGVDNPAATLVRYILGDAANDSASLAGSSVAGAGDALILIFMYTIIP
jgi:hypothetical protein